MAPSLSRQVQPSHLKVDDALRALLHAYPEHELSAIRDAEATRDRQSKLAFEYDSQHDKQALYRYKDVIKAFVTKNPICVWNWSLILAAVKK